MRNATMRFVLPLLFLTSFLFLCYPGVMAEQGPRTKLPYGNWTLSVGPYSGAGHEKIPVDVYSVTTDADKGLTVTRVSLLNRSGKDVAALSLHWYLMNREDRSILQEGDTPLIEIDLPAGETQVLSYPAVSFNRISRPLLSGSRLNGNYRLEISVGEIVYADESSRVGLQQGRFFEAGLFRALNENGIQTSMGVPEPGMHI